MSRERSSSQTSSNGEVIVVASTIDMSNVFYDGVIQQLASEGWEVHVVSSPGPTGQRLFGHVAKLHRLTMGRGLTPLRDVRSLVLWLRLLKRLRPRVLVVGTPKASLLGGLAGRIMRVPNIVYVIHGLRSEQASGPLAALLNTAERVTLRFAHHLLAVSPSLRHEVEATHPTVRGRIAVLGFGSVNGVDMTRFVPPSVSQRESVRTDIGVPSGAFVLGFVGRLHRDKGGGFILDLLQDAAITRLNAHLLIVGDIDDSSLSARVDVLAARGLLTVTGWMDRPETVMPSVDVLLHPTRREGLGMVLLEAQAMGIPVVTNRVTGTTDALHDSVGGYFADLDSIQSWAEQIASLASDEVVREQLGRQGREFVDQRYNRASVVPGFVRHLTALTPSITDKVEARTPRGGKRSK